MNQNPQKRRTRRSVWRVSRARAERLSIPVSVIVLAIETGIPMATISLFERGLAKITPEQEARRRAALARLRERANAEARPATGNQTATIQAPK